MPEKEIQKEQTLNKVEQKKKRQAKVCLVIFLVFVIFIVLIFIGNDSKNVVKPKQQLQQGQIRENETKIEPDFKITAEEIYSNYIKCQANVSVEDLVRKKYDGKIVEITGIVEKIIDYYKDTLAAKQGIDTSKYIDENKRYEICLADNQSHSCVVWVYSPLSQLINKVKKGDMITVTGQWQNVGSACGIPDLMNSEIKKIY